jgi:hypothetical protein
MNDFKKKTCMIANNLISITKMMKETMYMSIVKKIEETIKWYSDTDMVRKDRVLRNWKKIQRIKNLLPMILKFKWE